ncbi:apoptosis-resistant E3 ubiquitin protein ligase 1 [Pocillopora verrucosa]|uniref:apoptosis-resistant E3 ubiquitin protein ligase 1 n=1 Tax=Pocillopora verrucosa TaxID=203993 RepID=UPI00333F356D
MLNKIAVLIFGLGFLFYRMQVYFIVREEKAELHSWLEQHDLLDYETKLHKFGILTKVKFATLDATRFLTRHGSFWGVFTFTSEKEKLEQAVQKARLELQLLSWLQQIHLDTYYSKLLSQGINSVDRLIKNHKSDLLRKIVTDEDFKKFQEAVEKQQGHFVDSPPLRGVLMLFSFSWWSIKFVGRVLLVMVGSIALLVCLSVGFSRIKSRSQQHKSSFFGYVLGLALEPSFTKVIWEWEDPHIVGESMSFILKFYRMNATPYSVSKEDYILVEIMHNNNFIVSSREYGGEKWRDGNAMRVSFTVREAGAYKISVLVKGKPIRDSPFTKTFLPGVVDPSKCSILEGSSLLEVQQGIYTPLTVEARDKFGNVCPLSVQDVHSYCVEITEIGSSEKTDPELVILPDGFDKNNVLHIKLDDEGCFNAVVKYNGVTLNQGKLSVISLNPKDAEHVNKNIKNKCWNVWYEAYLLVNDDTSPAASSGSSTPATANMPSGARRPSSNFEQASIAITGLNINGLKKSRKVYCYISKKQLQIKEFYMRIIPHRLYGFRVRPTTKIILHPPDRSVDYPAFTVDDGSQPPITVMCKERNVLVATFSRLLLTKIGGSESFKDKQEFFYRELLNYHGRKTGEVKLKIDRRKLLESSYQATMKTFYSSDWLKYFKITFKDEPGVDWGGLRREWFELLCKALFSHEAGFFSRFDADDPQALVHPNPRRPAHLKVKFYEFAGRIVGKCLYESAMGSTRRLNVKARFSRSFLAQLLGLRVSYRYFEIDDKDFYRSKIKFIEENDPEDLTLVFAEEEYDQQGRLEKLEELKPGGAQIPVTESNKKEYLDLLAQYRLATSVKQEIEAFVKGLNEIVPDSLLSVFDEYELELLMCGTGNISVTDFQNNHTVTHDMAPFRKTLEWFWTIVTSFTQEELARLVQFITGSSQLPPGGFVELSPQIQISYAPFTNALPTAHTCFNQLCLPSYSSFKEMQKKLLLAINEGSEGFGFA